MLKIATGLFLASIAAGAAIANDSTAELATGGLVFVQNNDIEMRAEDLFISTELVRVHYRFMNTSAKDVTVLVAFPMPDISIEYADANLAVPTEDPINLLGFKTLVNGKPVVTKVEQRITALGIDRTEMLRALGIPFAPHLRTTGEALDRLPRDKWEDLIRIGLAAVEEYDIGKGMEQHLSPRWTLRTTFYWEQTFPSKRETAIEHEYKPSVGGSVGTGLGTKEAMTESWFSDYRTKYCMDKEFLAAIERARRAAGADAAPFFEQRIDYVLKTGANWRGPIKDFRLVIDKGDANSLVSFCAQGVKKISPTRFEVRYNDYVVTDDLAILILKRQPPN